jgi:hypothetical protein
MRILEELGTFIVSAALAVALIGVAAVMLYYFNPQQPVDYAKAAFYPLVKPLNKTHVWLGVKPSADRVEVVELKYQYGGRWVDVPVARLTADRAVWLNTTDGRPAAVPCFANVTVATRYGTASRAASFTPVCLQKQLQIRDDLTVLVEQMVSYGSYVLDYVTYKSTPVLTAYFGFGSMHIGFQNVGPFPYMAINGTLSGAGPWPPSFKALLLTPGRHENVTEIPSACDFYDGTCGVMYRWMNIYVYWNDTLEIWINNVRVYNGTPPAAAAEYTAPQGFTVAFDPSTGTLAVKYPSLSKVCKEEHDIVANVIRIKCSIVREWRTALTLSVRRGSTQWWGWVEMVNVPGPTSSFTINQTWNVMPAGPYVGMVGGFELFGVVPPFEVYLVYAAVNGSGLAVRIGDPNCGVSERCIRTFFYPQPGAYRIDTGVSISAPVYNRLDYYIDTKIPLGLPIYIDQHHLVAVTSTFRDYEGDAFATIGWYVSNVFDVITGDKVFYVGDSGPYTCYIQTNWAYNVVPLREGFYWQIECGRRQWYGWTSFGVIKLTFHDNYTVSVYKDGQYLYTVGPLNICSGSRCVTAPTQKLTIPVHWGPSGIIMAIVPFRYNPYTIGYGGMIYKRDMQTVAIPFYYKYNLTGAYTYRLEVKIDTSSKPAIGNYYNVTYSGYLKLYLGDKLVAYDAFHGWMYKLNPPPAYGSVNRPNEVCVPQKDVKRKGIIHKNFRKGEDDYSVEVYKAHEVHEFGCGVDRKYIEIVRADVATVSGTSYHVKDPNNKVCGFKQAQNCDGVVYCDRCPGEEST